MSQLLNLKQLDGKQVTDEERKQAQAALRHEQVVLALMISNACLVHKLVRVVDCNCQRLDGMGCSNVQDGTW